MKLPDFIEELNEGAEKAFGENAQARIDSVLCAKMPPKLEHSINMAPPENVTYEEIVTHLERETELNGLEEGDDNAAPTMSTAPAATRPAQGLLPSGIDPGITCNYCKKPDHSRYECKKFKTKQKGNVLMVKPPKKNTTNAPRATKQTTRGQTVLERCRFSTQAQEP